MSVEQAIVLYEELVEAMKANSFDAKIVAYDAAYTNTTKYLDELIASDVHSQIDVYACHQYVTAERSLRGWASRAKKYDKGLWMSEWGDWDNTNRTPKSNMRQMMNYAGKLHEAFDVLDADAWIMWEAGFIFDTEKKGLEKRKSYWAVAHYSRHVREGFQRVAVNYASKDVKTTAWMKSGAEGKLVFVTVNSGNKGRGVEFDLSGFENISINEVRQTSASENYKVLSADIDDISLTLAIPSWSITTVELDL